jgi:Tfp pilus assembly protein PilP
MKTNYFLTIMAGMLIATVSCKSKAQKDAEDYMNKIQKTVKENSPSNADAQQKGSTTSGTIPQGMENIVGEWELTKIIADHNGNHVIDPDEEKEATTTMQDYLEFNADGTCKYTIVKLEGRYEIVTKNNGRKKLITYDRTGTETNKGRYIVSVTDKELVLNIIMGGSDFEVFKRL